MFRNDHMIQKTARDDMAAERELWQQMRAGDEQALATLFRRHYAMLYDYGVKLARQAELAKDGIQEVFAYIWEKRETISAVDSARAYLLVALRRHLLKALEQQNKQYAFHQEFDLQRDRQNFSHEDFLILQETEKAESEALNRALQEIPPRVREALYLKTFNGLPYRDIAAIMQVSPQVARNYVSEAFSRLRTILSPSAKPRRLEKV
jgi:RNA polymerase sigma factor (sigma-70 family)